MRGMERIEAVNASIGGEAVSRWRREGGVVVGYACLLTPVELMEAAGAFPYRIKALGRGRTDLADARLSRFNCSFCRACLQRALEGDYDFLEGLVEANGCDQLRGMFENWLYLRPAALFHYLKVPHICTADALDYFTRQLHQLRDALARHLGREISDDDLGRSVACRRRICARLRRLDRLRRLPEPRLTGAEALAVAVAGGSVLAADYEVLLDEVLDQVERRPGRRPQVRLVMGGAATDEVGLIQAVEELDAAVVADTLCFGSRTCWPDADLDEEGGMLDGGDVIRALARQYLQRNRCPRMVDGFEGRLELLIATFREAAAHGVVLVHNKFCDLHGIDNALLRMRLEEQGIPVLALEKSYGAGGGDLGRLRTRIQAFFERVGKR